MAVGALGQSLITQGVGGLIGLAGTVLQNKYNKDLAKYQNDMNIANWNMQNEYNTPANQRKRLEEAGINPASVFGSNNTGNAGTIAPYQRAGVDITQSMLNGAQLALLSAQARKTNAEAKTAEDTNPYAGQTAKAILDGYLSNTKLTNEQITKTKQEVKNLEVSYNEGMTRISQMEGQIKLMEQQTLSEKTRRELTELQKVTETMQQALIQVNTSNARKTGDLLKNQNLLTEAQARSVNADAWMKEWENIWTSKFGSKPDSKIENMFLQTAGSCMVDAGRRINNGITNLKNWWSNRKKK